MKKTNTETMQKNEDYLKNIHYFEYGNCNSCKKNTAFEYVGIQKGHNEEKAIIYACLSCGTSVIFNNHIQKSLEGKINGEEK